jgi:ferredoxin-type protein NapG
VLPLVLLAYARPAPAVAVVALRPPGARAEPAFAAACVRCGLCVRACPYGTLHLAPPGGEVLTGTPWFEARSVPCEMCRDIPCLKACPTGALDPALASVEAARMGIAEVVNRENCLSLQGMHCDACYRACPVRGRAITLEQRLDGAGRRIFVPTVHASACTGCGKCEHACVPDVAAIRVVPRGLAKEGLPPGQSRAAAPDASSMLGRAQRAVRERRAATRDGG